MAFSLAYSCTSSEAVSKTGVASYKSKVKDLSPKFLVYHNTSNSSELYFELNSHQLLYVRENISEPFTATVTINYKLYGGKNNRELLDSATHSLVDKKTSSSAKQIIGKIRLETPDNNNYKLKIVATDINKKVKFERQIIVDKTNTANKQYYLITNAKNEVLFDLNFTSPQQLTVERNVSPSTSNYIGYYITESAIAKPTFADRTEGYTFPAAPDSIINLNFTNSTTSLNINKAGNYIIKSGSENTLSIKYFDAIFPTITNHQAMVMPIRYICTNSELATLKEAEDKQQAIENFWLKIGKTKERARYLIKEYYKRIEFANEYFSSYKEGWKTDRGMVSIVMGLPNSISSSGRGETWTYGTTNNMMMGLSFTFDKRNGNFIENDYQLDRFRSYKDSWYKAVETWRNGRAYSFN